MSQSPLNDDIPSNSHKSREEAANADNRPAVPIFEGEMAGAKRKKSSSFLRWLRKMFLSDQKPSDIIMNILENQIVPGMKDNFRNSVVSGIDAFVYQNSKPSTSNGSNNISYGKIYNSSANQSTKAISAPKQDSNVDLENGFTNPCFKYRNRHIGPNGQAELGAEDFLQMMREYDYPTMSVHTLYMMRKKHIDYTWDAYGWTKEEIANVKIVRIANPDYPWMIDLPQAHLI